MKTLPDTEPFTETQYEFTEVDSTPIENFTINEHNLSDGDFDKLLFSGRFTEWKAYAELNAPSVDERNLQRSIRLHRRREHALELGASTSFSFPGLLSNT